MTRAAPSRCAAALLVAALVLPAWAQAPLGAGSAQGTAAAAESPPRWDELTPAQRSALQPLRGEWARLDGSRKSKWLVVADRFPAMPEAERARLQQRMAEWARMTPAERARARDNYQAQRTLRPEDQRALWEAYRALPAETKRELARQPGPAARPAPPPEPRAATAGKRNLVQPGGPQVAGKPATPTMIQARPGATTTLVTKRPTPPAHNQPGLPKIAATKGFVDPSTLLPSRGPQGAAAVVPAASAAASPAAGTASAASAPAHAASTPAHAASAAAP